MTTPEVRWPERTWADANEARKQHGKVSAWLGQLLLVSAAETRDAAQRVEELGYSGVWLPESEMHRDALTNAPILLEATNKLFVGTGIANIWARDAAACRNAAFTLAEAFPGRFTLGLGISHKPAIAARGHQWSKPLAAMAAYVERLDAIAWDGPPLSRPIPLALGALRTKMVELAGERCTGVLPYFMPVEHTARARELLGPDRIVAPEMAVVVDPDPGRARARARRYAELYLGLQNYVNALRWLGFDDADVALPGSDRLIDAVIAWGDAEQVAARIRAQFEAGADHVGVQPVGVGLDGALRELGQLAPHLPLGDHDGWVLSR